jgi:hypothetical protein
MLYGEPTIRIAVPLAIGLVSSSNPQLPILDTLSEFIPTRVMPGHSGAALQAEGSRVPYRKGR